MALDPVSGTVEWQALAAAAQAPRGRRVKSLADPVRLERFVAEACGLRLDLTRQLFDADELDLLLWLIEDREVMEQVTAMFTGAKVNTTEERAALHTALRAPAGAALSVDGLDVEAAVQGELAKMEQFSQAVRDGSRSGATGEKFTTVVNLGIGGSDLGPRMATAALRPFASEELDVRFVSNVDPADLAAALHGLDPATTLFIVCSKTFTTLETMTNARIAREWIVESLGQDAVADHMVAVSTAEAEVSAFGIDPASGMFNFWDWVGGRYSVGSAIGLSLMIAIGPSYFRAFLSGMHEMDNHFRAAPAEINLPILLALSWLWNGSLAGHQSHAVLPYASDLRFLPAWLQQLDMESNGKSVRVDGSPVDVDTGTVVWGQAGTDGQHAFHQLLHQGTRTVPCDLIGFAKSVDPEQQPQQDLLVANLVAQAEALSVGRNEKAAAATGDAGLAPHRRFAGGRPVNVIIAKQLDPKTLGALLALYEHKVFVEAAIWGINPFDQYGVELGKELAGVITPELEGTSSGDHDPSTQALIAAIRSLRD